MINKVNEMIGQRVWGTNAGARKLALGVAYNTLEQAGHNVCILNEKYLEADGQKIQIVAKQGKLIAKTF